MSEEIKNQTQSGTAENSMPVIDSQSGITVESVADSSGLATGNLTSPIELENKPESKIAIPNSMTNADQKGKILKIALMIIFALSLAGDATLGYYYQQKNSDYRDQQKVIAQKNAEYTKKQEENRKLTEDLAAANTAKSVAEEALARATAEAAAPAATTTTTSTRRRSTSTSTAQEEVIAPPAPPSD